MRLLFEYLERAQNLETLGADETDPKLKAQLLEQAEAYYRLATKRAIQLGLPEPRRPKS